MKQSRDSKRTARPALICLGWLMVGAVAFWGAIGLDITVNLFDWRPSFDVLAVSGTLVFAAGGGA